uniref:Uncharacterized protein n=1 Tax=Saimiri boliviensis boliviensis TaxID=39432 RepID=A0A2K6U1A9_SAIBB
MAQFIHNLMEKTPALVNAAVTYSKPQLATFWYHAKVVLIPPTPAEISRAIQSLKEIVNSAQTGSFKQLTELAGKGSTLAASQKAPGL